MIYFLDLIRDWFWKDKNYIFVVVAVFIIITYIIFWIYNKKSLISSLYETLPLRIPQWKSKIHRIKELAEIYHHGTSDIYINNGQQKIDGMKPQPLKAIKCYIYLIRRGYPKYTLDLANIFHYGIQGFKPKKDLAELIYNKIIQSGHPLLATSARERLIQLQEEDNEEEIIEYYDSPAPEIDQTELEEVNNDVDLDNWDYNRLWEGRGHCITDNFRNQIEHRPNPLQNPTNNLGNIVDDLFNYDFIQPAALENMIHPGLEGIINDRQRDDRAMAVALNQAIYRANSQNVHDSGVVSSIKHCVNKIKKKTPMRTNKTNSLIEIRKMIQESTVGTIKKRDAIKALDYIIKMNGFVSSLKMNETDILNLVWNRINFITNNSSKSSIFPPQSDKDNLETISDDIINQSRCEMKKDLSENLITELAECMERGSTVCTQGRVARLIDTLNIVDKDVTIKDDTTFKRELLNKAGKIRNDIYNSLSDKIKKTVDKVNPTEDEQPIVNEYEDNLKNSIRQQLKREYVDTGLMRHDKFASEINKWIDDIV